MLAIVKCIFLSEAVRRRLGAPQLARAIALGAMAMVVSCAQPPSDETDGSADTESLAPEPGVDPTQFPEVLATVNGTEIEKSSLDERLARLAATGAASGQPQPMEFYRQHIDDLVDFELLFQASQEQGLALNDVAVDGKISEMRAQLPQPEMLEQTLAQRGVTLDQIKVEVQRRFSVQAFIDANVDSEAIVVNPEDVQMYYDEHPEEMIQPDQLRLSHILKLVDAAASEEDKQAARMSLEAVLEKARAGEDFGALAEEHSEDTGSAPRGGEMVIRRGQTVPPFEQAAFALEPDEITDIVETRFGFHIIKLSERIAGETVALEQVRAQIEGFLTQQGRQKQVEEVVQKLREQAELASFI